MGWRSVRHLLHGFNREAAGQGSFFSRKTSAPRARWRVCRNLSDLFIRGPKPRQALLPRFQATGATLVRDADYREPGHSIRGRSLGMAPSPQPFQLSIPETVLVDLKARLAMTRFPDHPSDSPWTYGTDLEYMRSLQLLERRFRPACTGSRAERLSPAQDQAARHRCALPARAGERAITHATVADASSIRDGMEPGSQNSHSVNNVIMGKRCRTELIVSGRLFERGASWIAARERCVVLAGPGLHPSGYQLLLRQALADGAAVPISPPATRRHSTRQMRRRCGTERCV